MNVQLPDLELPLTYRRLLASKISIDRKLMQGIIKFRESKELQLLAYLLPINPGVPMTNTSTLHLIMRHNFGTM